MKKISIVTPHYNYDQYISEMLSSISEQTVSDIEVIIVDDHSSESSLNNLQKIITQFPLLDIHLIRHIENRGAAESRNTGLKTASGEFVVVLDADDMLCGRYNLEYRLSLLESNTSLSGVSGYAIRVNKEGKVLFRERRVNKFFILGTNPDKTLEAYCKNILANSNPWISALFYFSGSSMFRRKDLLDFPFDSHYEKEEDMEWILRFLEHKKIKLEMVPFLLRREHENQYHLNVPDTLISEIKDRCRAILDSSSLN